MLGTNAGKTIAIGNLTFDPLLLPLGRLSISLKGLTLNQPLPR